MTRLLPLTLTALLAAPMALAQDCPPAPDHSAAARAVIAELQQAPSERAAQVYNAQLWEMWLDAPDARAAQMLREGMERRRIFDLAGAVVVFTQLIDYCPDYAEGYNQRAFAYYLQTDFSRALADLDETLKRNPAHIGALSGKALTLMGMGRGMLAQQTLREALALNPWLPERVYLAEETPAGEEL